MTVTGYIRGHHTTHDGNTWRDNNGQPVTVDNPCAHCHQPPTPEGHDPCLGTLPGVISACCGHGVQDAWVMTADRVRHPLALTVWGDL